MVYQHRRAAAVVLLVVVYQPVAVLALDTFQTHTSSGCAGIRIGLGEIVRCPRIGGGRRGNVLILVELRRRSHGRGVGQLRGRKRYQTTWRGSRQVW